MKERPILFSDNAEQWCPIKGFEGRYEVSSYGRVRSLSTYRPHCGGDLTPWKQCRGYQYVSLRRDGSRKTFAVHRLVLEAFVGPRPESKQVAHNDGDPSNNRLSNLRWASSKENIADRARHGRTAAGEDNGSAKLDRHVVKTIRRMQGAGFSAYETARLASVSPSTIESIWQNNTWRHV